MISPSTVKRIQSEVKEQVHSHQSSLKTKLNDWICSSVTKPEHVCRRAFAIAYYVQKGFMKDVDELNGLVEQGQSDFSAICEVGRGLKKFERQFNTVAGNGFAKLSDFPRAIELYRKAVAGEKDLSIRNLNYLNIAKVYLQLGDFFHVLYWVGKMNLKLESEVKYVIAARLLQVRANIILGLEKNAKESLKELRNHKIHDHYQDLERRYLGLMCRFQFTKIPQFLKRYDDFLSFVATLDDKRASNFYELENLLLSILVDRKRLSSWKSILARGKYLSEQVKGQRHLDVLVHLSECFKKKVDENDYLKLNQAIFQLAPSNHRLFQILALLVSEREFRKQFDVAGQNMLLGLQFYFSRLTSGLSGSIVNQTKESGSEIARELARQLSRVPRIAGPSEEFFSDQWLP